MIKKRTVRIIQISIMIHAFSHMHRGMSTEIAFFLSPFFLWQDGGRTRSCIDTQLWPLMLTFVDWILSKALQFPNWNMVEIHETAELELKIFLQRCIHFWNLHWLPWTWFSLTTLLNDLSLCLSNILDELSLHSTTLQMNSLYICLTLISRNC